MQSTNGGFAAFDVDNTHYNLNYIPFADHGALLDPPTSDVTRAGRHGARRVGRGRRTGPRWRARSTYLRQEQEADGSWFGRWGTQLHLWHLVGVDGAWRRPASRADDADACGARSSGSCSVRSRRRLGREQRQLRAGNHGRPSQRPEHSVPDGLGAARLWPRAQVDSRPCGAASNICCGPRSSAGCGAIRLSPRRAFRACSISSITAIAPISRSGRWRPTEISAAPGPASLTPIVGVVCALAAEARHLGPATVVAPRPCAAGRRHPAGGERHGRAAAAAAAPSAHRCAGATALASWGMAGGTGSGAARRRPVLPDEVICTRRCQVRHRPRAGVSGSRAALAAQRPADAGRLLTSDRPSASPAAKATLVA